MPLRSASTAGRITMSGSMRVILPSGPGRLRGVSARRDGRPVAGSARGPRPTYPRQRRPPGEGGTVRHTEFWARMEQALGPAYARTWAEQQVLAELDHRTVQEALAQGE